jgi:hypothetical protein
MWLLAPKDHGVAPAIPQSYGINITLHWKFEFSKVSNISKTIASISLPFGPFLFLFFLANYLNYDLGFSKKMDSVFFANTDPRMTFPLKMRRAVVGIEKPRLGKEA